MADGPQYPPPQPISSQPPATPPPSTVFGTGTGPAGGPGVGAPPASIGVGKRPGRVRWGVLVLGIVVILVGVISIVVGAVFLLAESALNVADSEAEGRLPDADLSFEADDATYDVFLSGRGASEFDANDVRCDITLADGERLEVRGDRQAVATSGAVESVGSFDAVDGFTEVRCTSSDEGELARIYVGRDRQALEVVGYVGIGVGFVLAMAGLALVLFAVFKRKERKGPTYTPVSGPAGPPGAEAGPSISV